MSDAAPETSAPQKPQRNPVERLVVWGLILVLLGVLAFEAKQQYAYGAALKSLQEAFKEDDADSYHKLSDVRKMMGGSPKETALPAKTKLHRSLEFQWASLFKEYKLVLQTESIGDDPLVLSFMTPDSEEPAEPVAAQPTSTPVAGGPTMPGMGGGGPAMGGPGGPGGGGPGGPGGPGGGGGQQRPRTLQALAEREDVIAELKLTDEQVEKIKFAGGVMSGTMSRLRGVPEAERSAFRQKAVADSEASVKDAMQSDQYSRLMQLYWRDLGSAALEREDAAAAVGLTDEQKTKLREVLDERRKEMGGMRDAPPDEVAKKRKEWDDKIIAVLTEEQAKKWEEALGAPLPETKKADK